MHPEQPLNKTRIFFPNLDGLRFISFFVVFLYHCYISFFSYLQESSPGVYRVLEFLFQHGNLGVNFFFVLSGFLITYLLIKEKEFTGSIHVGKFYVRRILRIWPLYYLCLIIGFIIFPLLKKMGGEAATETASGLHYVFLAANFDLMHTWPVKPDAINLTVLWSVAIEEQFYLTWPLILLIFPLKRYKFIFILIMLFSLIYRSFFTGNSDADYAVRYFHTFSVIGDMALGALLAYSCSFPNKFKLFITNLGKIPIALIYIGTLLVTLLKDYIFPPGIPVIFERLVIGFFFGLIILEQNFSVNSLFKMGNSKLMSRLGIYTYGLYCLHLLGMYLAVKLVTMLKWNEQSVAVAFFSCAIALLISIGVSLASFHLFEKWFLKLKDRFAFIVKR